MNRWKKYIDQSSTDQNLNTTQSLKGGVTLVQIREKHVDTGEVRPGTIFYLPSMSLMIQLVHRDRHQIEGDM